MKILDDLLSTLSNEARVKDIRLGPFQTAVLTLNCGLASTPHYEGTHKHGELSVKEAGLLLEKNALESAQMVYSASPMEAAIGMAAINSLLNVDEKSCVRLNASELLADKGKGKRVAIVGHFPFVPMLRQAVKELWVIERRPQAGDFTAAQAETLIPQAEVVGITGTAFTNHTIEHLLGLCHPKAYVVVLGGTAPLSPVLFNYGVDAVCGTKVVNAEETLRCVSQGATFRQVKGIQLLTMKK